MLTIHQNPKASQHQIGKLTGLSSAMVNKYIRELHQNGSINVSGETNRTQKYHLTPLGHEKLQSLLRRYSTEINKLHANAQGELTRIKKIAKELSSTSNRMLTESGD